MTKDELKDIARVGVRNVLLKFEEQLGELFHEFPDAFVSDTAPVLARPELRNGHAPAALVPVVVVKSKSKKKDKTYGSSAAVKARRQVSSDILEVVAKSARPLQLEEMIGKKYGGPQDIRGILPLIRRGYLKKTAKGFVRTSKVFYVDKEAAARAKRAAEKRA